MTKTIKDGLERFTAELAAGTPLVEEWRDLLAGLAEHYPSPGWEEKVTPSLRAILAELGGARTFERLSRLAREVTDFPQTDVCRLLFVLSDQLRQDQEARLRELNNALTELATPVIRIWTDVLLVPLIGSLDAQRAEAMAERLLERVSATRAKTVIVDVTGLPLIDTAVGSFLIETFTATKLLGSEIILTGIKPHVAHTLAKLGVDFRMVGISRDLEDALRRAIRMQEAEEEQKRRQLGGWALGEAGDESRT